MKHNVGYFASVPKAKLALKFLSSFPGTGGKRCFGIGKWLVSGAPSVFYDPDKYRELNPGVCSTWTPDMLDGALRAMNRITSYGSVRFHT